MVRLKASSFAPSAPPIPAPVDESLEIAQQMRPADLPQLYPLVRGPAVDHEEAALATRKPSRRSREPISEM